MVPGGGSEMQLWVSPETTRRSLMCGHIVMYKVFSLSNVCQLTIDLSGYNSIRNQDRSPVFMQQKLVSVATKGSDLIVLIVRI